MRARRQLDLGRPRHGDSRHEHTRRGRPQDRGPHRRRVDQRRPRLRGAQQRLTEPQQPAHHPQRQRHVDRRQCRRAAPRAVGDVDLGALQPPEVQDLPAVPQMGPHRRQGQGADAPLQQRPQVARGPAAEHLRGPQHQIFRPVQRQRRAEDRQGAPGHKGDEGAEDPAPAHAQGQGIRRRRNQPRALARPGQIRPRDRPEAIGKPSARRRAAVAGGFRRDPFGTRREERVDSRNHSRDAHGHVDEQDGALPQPHVRRRHLRGARRDVRWRPRRRGQTPVLGDIFLIPAAWFRQHHPRRGHTGAACDFLHRPRRNRRRGRRDPPRHVRHPLSAHHPRA